MFTCLRLLIPLFLFLGLTSLPAQNWNPLPKDATLLYHFRDIPQNRTAFVAAKCDSIRVEGQDSVFYLFRMDAVETSSQTVTGCNNQTIYPGFRASVDHFYGKKMLFNPNGDALFISSDADTLLLQTMAGLGETWNWNDTTIASVFALTMEPVLGSLDSLKHIALSSGDTLVLGKSSGLVRAFSFFRPPISALDGLPFQLWGVPEHGLGGALPDIGEIFGFAQGDEFVRYENYNSFPFGGYRVEWNNHHRIDSIFASGDNPSYKVWVERNKKITSQQQGNSQQYFPPMTDTLVFDSAQYSYLNLLPFQSRSSRSSEFYYFMIQTGVYRWDIDTNRIVKRFEFGFLLDTCSGYFHVDGLMYGCSAAYVSGIGLWLWQENGFDWSDRKTITCFHTQPGDFGSCPPFNTLGEPSPMGESSFISIFPNPANSTLNVVCAESRIRRSISLLGCDGSITLNSVLELGETEAELDVSSLRPGLYMLRVDGPGKSPIFKKVVVGH